MQKSYHISNSTFTGREGIVAKKNNKLIRQNQRIGLRTAFYESPGRQPKTLKEAAAHFGVKVP